MNNSINVLDCTLRDGGYCNNWNFGSENIQKIINGLSEANVDIIECGFLTQKEPYEIDRSKFNSLAEIKKFLPKNKKSQLFVCMINYGEYDINELPDCDGASLQGLRIAFHKKDMVQALEYCKAVKQKGYKVFIQAMVSLNYTDEEFLNLIKRCNEIEPYAFYIVDSFGVMKRKELTRLFYMVEHNLKEKVLIGYHSHNNMQLSYSNAQLLIDIRTKRSLIIDTSIFGMGRGAGNLNTELFVDYLNDNIGTNYELKPLLNVIDEVLNNFYQNSYWGYSLPNYLSAVHNAHPNYAGWLDSKKTLTIENMEEIFSMMDSDKKAVFDKKYIQDLYVKYLATGKTQEAHLEELKDRLKAKRVLLIAPGRSSIDEKDKVIAFAQQNDVVTVSINYCYQEYEPDFIFVSNLRRFRILSDDKKPKSIVTSNIPADNVYLQTKYSDLLNNVDMVRDNAGLMLIRFLMNLGVKDIYLAGLDGYSHDRELNYADNKMAIITQNAVLDVLNQGITIVLKEYSKEINIEFLTEQKHIKI
ncbi:MAG: aldolase catalytic domain-containing protein [Candidatus Riflebacteria bacterium]|nr:aldolase catalytic domain-containing protein [Candidatus Riflebacteria bacterium]